MTFAARNITVQLQLNGDTFDEGGDSLQLQNMRCRATIQSTIGGATPFAGQMQLQIWGMTASDMAKLSTLGFSSGLFNRNRIVVMAGDNVNGMTQVFSGSIYSASIDYNAMPDVCVEIEAYSQLPWKLQRIAATSQAGSVSVATLLQAIAASCSPPLAFVDKGVTSTISNPAYSGTPYDQISSICQDVACNYDIIDGTLTIWPFGQVRDDVTLSTSSDNGMVGYPMYTGQGVDVVMEFNPQAQLGRKLVINTSIPKPGASNPPVIVGLPGTFYIYEVTHDLAAELPNGPWFTKARVGAFQAAHFV